MNTKKIFYSKWVFCLLIIVLIALLVFLYKHFLIKKYLETKFYNIQAKTAAFEKENEEMEGEIANLKDRENLEKLGRRLYILKKPGEEAMVMPGELLATPTPISQNTEPINFFESFLNKFKALLNF